MIINLVKYIPLPTYGNYGGYYKRCKSHKTCPLPEDEMDELFLAHDNHDITDLELGHILQEDLSPYYRPTYGNIFRIVTGWIFRTFGRN